MTASGLRFIQLLVEGELLADSVYTCTDLISLSLEISSAEVDVLSDLLHLLNAQASCSNSRSTDTDTAGHEGLLRIVVDSVLVNSDVDLVQSVLQLLAGDVEGTQVDQHQVVISTAGNEVKTSLEKAVSQSLSILNDLSLILLELRLKSLAEANSLSSDSVHKRTALSSGEDSGVDLLSQSLVISEDKAASGSTESLMCSSCSDVSVGNR